MIERYDRVYNEMKIRKDGDYVEVGDVVGRLEAILYCLNTANLAEVSKVQLEQLIEELQ